MRIHDVYDSNGSMKYLELENLEFDIPLGQWLACDLGQKVIHTMWMHKKFLFDFIKICTKSRHANTNLKSYVKMYLSILLPYTHKFILTGIFLAVTWITSSWHGIKLILDVLCFYIYFYFRNK